MAEGWIQSCKVRSAGLIRASAGGAGSWDPRGPLLPSTFSNPSIHGSMVEHDDRDTRYCHWTLGSHLRYSIPSTAYLPCLASYRTFANVYRHVGAGAGLGRDPSLSDGACTPHGRGSEGWRAVEGGPIRHSRSNTRDLEFGQREWFNPPPCRRWSTPLLLEHIEDRSALKPQDSPASSLSSYHGTSTCGHRLHWTSKAAARQPCPLSARPGQPRPGSVQFGNWSWPKAEQSNPMPRRVDAPATATYTPDVE